MDLDGFMLSDISQTEKDKYCMILYALTYMWNQKNKNKTPKNKKSTSEKMIRFMVITGKRWVESDLDKGGQNVQTYT